MASRKNFQRYVWFAVALLGCALMLYPLVWMISSSFKPEALIFYDRSLFIREFTFENYIRGFGGVAGIPFWRFMVNTFQIVIPVVIGTVISCSMAAFAFVRLRFVGIKIYFVLMILTMMLPVHGVLIPRFLMFNALGWIDTYLPLTVPAFFGLGSFFIFLFVQFIRGIPVEIDQAATVDGCGPIQIYIRIIMPLCVPAILTSAIFSFIWTYDDFFSQLIYIHTASMFTVSLALRQYTEVLEESAFGTLFAMSTVALLPLFIFFISCQKYLVEGIATTGIKG